MNPYSPDSPEWTLWEAMSSFTLAAERAQAEATKYAASAEIARQRAAAYQAALDVLTQPQAQ